MNHNRFLGSQGERMAQSFLKRKGHKILEVNFRHERSEVDLISLDGEILVFSEVKTRTNFYYGFPEEAVTARKQATLKMVAEHYLLDHPEFSKLRFDVISVVVQKGQLIEIVHFEDAFY